MLLGSGRLCLILVGIAGRLVRTAFGDVPWGLEY